MWAGGVARAVQIPAETRLAGLFLWVSVLFGGWIRRRSSSGCAFGTPPSGDVVFGRVGITISGVNPVDTDALPRAPLLTVWLGREGNIHVIYIHLSVPSAKLFIIRSGRAYLVMTFRCIQDDYDHGKVFQWNYSSDGIPIGCVLIGPDPR